MVLFPVNWIRWRVLIGGSTLVATLCLHFLLVPSMQLAYIIDAEYVIFAVYALTVLLTFLSVSAYQSYDHRFTLLKQIPHFESFSEKVKSTLSKKMRLHRYREPGEVLFRQGDPGNSLFIVIEGEVGIWIAREDGQLVEVARSKAGSFFGEVSLLTGSARTASVVVATPALIGEITTQHILPFLRKNPDMVQSMTTVITQRRSIRESGEHPVDENALIAELTEQVKRFLGIKT
jgi:hypothetical protein